jgi:hypothetical protein
MRTLAACAMLALFTGCGSCGPQPPPPALPRNLPPEAFEGGRRSDDGLPIIATADFDGLELQLVYDEAIDDPLSLRGQCLDRVAACYRANHGELGGCVDLIEVCPDPAGGHGCCPQACIDAYHAHRKTLDEQAAVEASFVAGDCIPGFREQMSILEEVEP